VRAFTAISLIAVLSAVVLPGGAVGATPPDGGRLGNRTGDVQYFVPDPGRWCTWYASTQLGQAVGINFTYVGLAGSMSDNSLACRMSVAGGPGAKVHGSWYGVNGVAPQYQVLVDFRQACSLQYPGTSATWVDARRGWYCTSVARHGYNQGSRPMK
jgi:hypothetical protein